MTESVPVVEAVPVNVVVMLPVNVDMEGVVVVLGVKVSD